MKQKSRKKFTLIELLTVMAIIALLAAIFMPAMSGIINSAKNAKAREMANAIVTAIAEYETEYLEPPGWDEDGDGNIDGTDIFFGSDVVFGNAINGGTSNITQCKRKYDVLIQILTSINLSTYTDGKPVIDNNVINLAHVANKREIQFLEPPDKFMDNGYIDPWGTRFIILLDYDFNGEVDLDGTPLKGSRAFAYSCGADGVDDNGGNDDVCSWK